MSRGGFGGARSVSLDQLIALNDEMAALVRAGVPMEQGLAELARDMPGRLGEIAALLSRRMSGGESLAQILAGDPRRFPPVWYAVVEAGLRSGRLCAALEGMATTGRRVAELRRGLGVAFIYPLFVLAAAYCLFVFLLSYLAPVTLGAYEDLTSSSDFVLRWMAWLGETAQWWAMWLPAAVVLVLAVWWRRSGRAAWSHGGAEKSPRAGISAWRWPSVRQSLHDGRMATFAEILSLLIEQNIPMEEAIVLAAEAGGDKGLRRAAEEMAERLRRGETLAGRDSIPAPLPPLLGWLILTGMHQPGLSKTLSLTADRYRQRAARAAHWTTVYLPIVLTAIFGGTVTLIQALAVFGPIWKLLYDLGKPF